MNYAMATLGLKEMEKGCPVGCLLLVFLTWESQQGRPFSLPSQRNFSISFKPKVAIGEFFWKMQRKTWFSIFGVVDMPLSLKNLLLIEKSGLHSSKLGFLHWICILYSRLRDLGTGWQIQYGNFGVEFLFHWNGYCSFGVIGWTGFIWRARWSIFWWVFFLDQIGLIRIKYDQICTYNQIG